MSSTGIPEKTPLDLQMRLLLKQVDPVIRPRVSIVSFRQTSTDGVQTMDCPGRDQSGARAAHIISLYILPTSKRHGVPGPVEVRAIRSQSRRVAVPSLDLAHGRGPADGMTGVSSRDISEEAIESRALTGVIKIERDYVEKNLGCSGGLGSTSRASSRGAGHPSVPGATIFWSGAPRTGESKVWFTCRSLPSSICATIKALMQRRHMPRTFPLY